MFFFLREKLENSLFFFFVFFALYMFFCLRVNSGKFPSFFFVFLFFFVIFIFKNMSHIGSNFGISSIPWGCDPVGSVPSVSLTGLLGPLGNFRRSRRIPIFCRNGYNSFFFCFFIFTFVFFFRAQNFPFFLSH